MNDVKIEYDPDTVWILTKYQKSTKKTFTTSFKYWDNLIKCIKEEFETRNHIDLYNEKQIEKKLFCTDGDWEYYIYDTVVFKEVR